MNSAHATLLGIGVSVAPAAACAGGAPQSPDVTLFSLDGVGTFGAVDGIRSFSFGFRACNVGDAPID